MKGKETVAHKPRTKPTDCNWIGGPLNAFFSACPPVRRNRGGGGGGRQRQRDRESAMGTVWSAFFFLFLFGTPKETLLRGFVVVFCLVSKQLDK